MLDRLVKEVMEGKDALALAPETTVRAAARLMAEKKTGAVMVVERGKLVGIFTERDALFRVVAPGLDADNTRLAEAMTAGPRTVGPNDSYGYALVLMQEGGFRHTPVVEDGRPIGMVSSRNAMDPDLEEFVAEENRRMQFRMGH